MDDKYLQKYDSFVPTSDWQRIPADRKRENQFGFCPIDSSVDSAKGGPTDKMCRYRSPRVQTKEWEQQMRVQSEQLSPQEAKQLMEKNESVERQLQQSVQLLNQKKQVQRQLIMMQQKQLDQQRLAQHQQGHQCFRQHFQNLQKSPERREEFPRNDHQRDQEKVLSPPVNFSESFDNQTVHDLFVQCQNHLDLINACTDLQQTIKDEMKKQAKLDNIICQKLVSKSQRLQQQAIFLEQAHAPIWVGPALQELGTHVSQQAEMHHVYTATLLEQCGVIQHSLDGHHELMKSVLAQDSDNLTHSQRGRGMFMTTADKMIQSYDNNMCRSMTFLQASNIFEGIRKPRMKLLSSLEYQQEQLNATLAQLNQVDTEIESLMKFDEGENLMWRLHLQKKDLKVRKEFLETRKEQLQSDVQLARMDLSDFEMANKDSMLEVLNVFRQHRVRYDTTLRKSFQLLKAATLRDMSFLKKFARKSEPEAHPKYESGDTHEAMTCSQHDPWICDNNLVTKMDATLAMAQQDNMDKKDEVADLTVTLSPKLTRNKNTQFEKMEFKPPTVEVTFSGVLSSDSEISFLSTKDKQRSGVYSGEFKQVKKTKFGSSGPNHLQNLIDYNFSRADLSFTNNEVKSEIKDEATNVSENHCKSSLWNVMKERKDTFLQEMQNANDDKTTFIITKYLDDTKSSLSHSPKREMKYEREDITIVSSGPLTKTTLGNFENSIDNECSVNCLYPLKQKINTFCKWEDERMEQLINKYAPSSHKNRSNVVEKWGNSRPLQWSGICKGMHKENSSRLKLNRSLRSCEPVTSKFLLEFNESHHTSSSENLVNFFKGQNLNNSESLKQEDDEVSSHSFDSSSEDKVLCEPLIGHSDCEQLLENSGCEQVIESCEQIMTQSNCEQAEAQDSCEQSAGTTNTTQDSQSTLACEPLTGSSNDFNMSGPEPHPDHKLVHSLNGCQQTTNNHTAEIVNDICSSESQTGICFDLLPGQMSRNLNNCEPLKNHAVDPESLVEREDCLDFEVTQVLFPENHPRNIQVCAVRPIPLEADGSGARQATGNNQNSDSLKNLRTDQKIYGKYDNLRVYEITAGQFIVQNKETESKCKREASVPTANCSNNKQADFCEVSSQTHQKLASSKKPEPYTQDNESVLCGKLESERSVGGGPTGKVSEAGGNITHSRMYDTNIICLEPMAEEENLKTMVPDDKERIIARPELKLQKVEPKSLVYTLSNNSGFGDEETLPKTLYVTQLSPEYKGNHPASKPKDVKELQAPDGHSHFLRRIKGKELTTNNTNSGLAKEKDIFENSGNRINNSQVNNEIIEHTSLSIISVMESDENMCNQQRPQNVVLNSQLFQEGRYTNNFLAQTQNCPLKSSLKKSNVACSVASNEPQDVCSDRVLQCQLVGQSNNESRLQRSGDVVTWHQASREPARHLNTKKTQKCIKQVRFDHRVHYDDNTEVNTADVSWSPDETTSLNTNKNCICLSRNFHLKTFKIECLLFPKF